jgi:hypothetical protein
MWMWQAGNHLFCSQSPQDKEGGTVPVRCRRLAPGTRTIGMSSYDGRNQA